MENILLAWPVISGGSMGLGGSYLGMPSFREELENPETGDYIGPGKLMSAYQYKGAAGYGQFLSRWGDMSFLGPLWKQGAVGVSVVVLGETIGTTGSYSVSADLGYLFDDPASGRRLGLVVRELGAPANGAPLPVTGQAGVVQEIAPFSISADILTATDDSYRVRGGVEWAHEGDNGSVALRLGAQHSFSSHLNGWLSMGIGYRLNLAGGLQTSIDYAFVPVDAFDSTHAVSVEASF